jgi:integrase
MTAARGFARYLAGVDPATQIPPVGLVPLHHQRPTPFLYSSDDISELLAAARALTPASRGLTYYTLLGLLAATGMRIGEAIALDLSDVDREQDVLRGCPGRRGTCGGGPPPDACRGGSSGCHRRRRRWSCTRP